MRIDAYICNPVIATQQDYYDLEELLQEIEPDCELIQLPRTAYHCQYSPQDVPLSPQSLCRVG